MFSLEDLMTFRRIPQIRDQLYKNKGVDLSFVVIGNKSDKFSDIASNQEKLKQIRHLVQKKWRVNYYELSLKNSPQQNIGI